MNAQDRNAPMTKRKDFSEAVNAILDLRQIDEQESNYPDFTEPSDSSKTIARNALDMEDLVHTIFVFVGMDRIANLVDLAKVGGQPTNFSYKDLRLQAMAIPVNATGGVNSTPHPARVTHANIFSRVAQAHELHLFCVPS